MHTSGQSRYYCDAPRDGRCDGGCWQHIILLLAGNQRCAVVGLLCCRGEPLFPLSLSNEQSGGCCVALDAQGDLRESWGVNEDVLSLQVAPPDCRIALRRQP